MHDTDQAALDAARAILAGPTRHPPGPRRLPEVSIPRPPRRLLVAAVGVGVFLIGFVAGTVRDSLAVPPWSVFLGALGVIVGFAVGLTAGSAPLASSGSGPLASSAAAVQDGDVARQSIPIEDHSTHRPTS